MKYGQSTSINIDYGSIHLYDYIELKRRLCFPKKYGQSTSINIDRR